MRHLMLATLLSTIVPAAMAHASPDARADTGPLALDQVHLVDVEQARTSPPRCVRIEYGRLARIDDAGDPACLRAARRIDLGGRYLLPGLVDMHAHHTLGPLEIVGEGADMVVQALPDDAIAAHNARRLVAFGVTTIRNPGGDLAAAARYRDALALGALTGPEAFDAGPVINNAELPGLAVAVHDAQEMERVVEAQVEAGADWIKLYTGLSPALLQAGIDAAHRHGRPAVAHLDGVAWPDALAMGLDGIVHLMPLSPDLLDAPQRAAWQAGSRGATWSFFEWWEHFDPDGPGGDALVAAFERHRPVFDATLVAFHAAFVQDDPDNPYRTDARELAPARLLASWNGGFTFAMGWEPGDFVRARAIWTKVQRMAVRLHATGARMTVGTDMGNPWVAPGISLHREMQLLAEAGVSAPQVLLAATRNGAEALGAGTRLGRIAEGYEADLLVLDANPLDDITRTRGIHAVVLDGRYLDRATLDRFTGE
ncbi:amidohydrolase family protein [Pseudoxanthomonas kaohsiungensis]|uniref:Amidohydrolase family protein n=1 Tax=Pseudoxanthomonas kaohsiungensis TaxID=283923 RepID=A0ABW3LTU5_9GAMM|nr:amidohydrolase family protein [Pseudoxanthomonas kaohsiungensis]